MKKTFHSTLLVALCMAASSLPLIAQSSGKAKPGSIEYAKNAALEIDRQVAQLFKSKGLKAPENVSDSQFLRRTSLIVAGRIPTVKEVSLFLDMQGDDKREKYIDYALNSEGYNSSMTNWIYDKLRAQETLVERGRAQPYIDWMRNSIQTNKSWKNIAHELVSAEGLVWENGAVGYYIRDKGMPLDNMANTMQLFAGARVECAQCHDDPNSDWERKDFFHLAAFTHDQPEVEPEKFREYYRTIYKQDVLPIEHERLLVAMQEDIISTSLKGKGTGRVALPEDYQYRDGKPNEIIGAKTPFYKKVRTSSRRDSDNSREMLADWLTSKENTRFATTIANRLWRRVFGAGLYEPVDVYVEPNETIAPSLIRYMTQLMQDLDYDMKEFQRVLLLTRIYNFKASLDLHYPSDVESLAGRQLQRMSAEQIWDSLVTLTVDDPDKLPRRATGSPSKGYPIYYRGKTLFKGEKNMQQLIKEIYAIKDSDEMESYIADLIEEFDEASSSSKGAKKPKGSMMMMSAAQNLGPKKGLVRASELATNTKDAHLLKEFGQSSRLFLEDPSRDPNVPQVLSMLNGHVEKLIVSNSTASIHSAIKTIDSPEDKVNMLFLSILGRTPSSQESELFVSEIKKSGDSGVKNTIAAILGSREFLFVQ